MKRTTTRKTRQVAAPGAAAKPFSSWLSGIAAETAPIEGTMSGVLRAWHQESKVEPAGRANPVQAARLTIALLEALGIQLIDGLWPQADEVAACIEAELLKDAGLAQRERAYKQSIERANYLRLARQYVRAARGEPDWDEID